MKVLVFSHKSDIDGMGGVILAKLAFKEVDYVLTETYKLQEELLKYYKNNTIYDYDYIFITDMWLEEPMLTRVFQDERLKDKFYVFNHHMSSLKEGYNKYDFVTIKVSNELGLCSGTSLFYEFLVKEQFLSSDNGIKRFVELTRRYDTWEWVTKYNDEEAHELTLLFDILGSLNYINLVYNKLKLETNEFKFNEVEKMLIENKKKQVQVKLENYVKNIYYKEVMGLKAGIIFIEYEYRNDIAEYIRNLGLDLDFIMLVALDYGTISYRNIKADVNVRVIAEAFGGKGHDKAAASPISEAKKEAIIKILIQK